MQSPVGGGIFVASVRHRSHQSPEGAGHIYSHKYAAPTGLDGASGLPVPQICRPYGAWIGASPKSVIISHF